jgi:hypothetical protein
MVYLVVEPLRENSPLLRERETASSGARRRFDHSAGVGAPQIIDGRGDGMKPATLIDLGALRGVIYTRDRSPARRTYIHFMEDPPRLLCDAQGRQLYVRGGRYRITPRGIEG